MAEISLGKKSKSVKPNDTGSFPEVLLFSYTKLPFWHVMNKLIFFKPLYLLYILEFFLKWSSDLNFRK